MPVKKDATNRRWVELEILVPGTPEQVWQAMATGPGMNAWFTPTTVEERVGGAITFDLGEGATSAATVTAWEPPVHFAYEERDWSEGAPPLATEVVVTSRSGDRCVVRMVHSLFSAHDGWDDELESFESGWPGFFEVLRLYLARFPGQPPAPVRLSVSPAGGELAAWISLTRALNLAAANVGERWEAPAGAPRLAGVVERVHQDHRSREVLLRLEAPGPGVALLGTYVGRNKPQAGVNLVFYGPDGPRTAEAVSDDWSRWLRATVGAPASG